MRRLQALAELRTGLAGFDPGLLRLRLAGIGTASMVLAAAVMSGVRVLSGQPVAVVLFAAVLAMVSNIAVNEPDARRTRVTTLFLLAPALVSITVGTLLVSHRVVADGVFVAVTVVAVYIRRFGPRGFALGMAGFMSFFLTQFLHTTAAQLPWLLLAAGAGIGSTLLLRGWVFAERVQRTRHRLVRAFRAHLHALVEAVADLLAAPPQAVEQELRDVRRRHARLNETALLVADSLEQLGCDHDGSTGREDGDGRELALDILDAELAGERLAVATWRLVQHRPSADADGRRLLLAALHHLGRATTTGTPPAMAAPLLEGARRSVSMLAEQTHEHEDRAQRLAFAVIRLADALSPPHGGQGAPPPVREDPAPHPPAEGPGGGPRSPARPGDPGTSTGNSRANGDETPGVEAGEAAGLPLNTRQAVQAGIATSLAIMVGELVSPARWYWAVITAFIVFAGTTSRGDVLSRGGQRILGTIGGVLAGIALAVLVDGHELPTLLLIFGCVFLALYLVRISQALMAFWITAVLALLYGLIGQFSIQTLILRIEETAIGAALGMLAGYLVLPTRTRQVFNEALDDMVDAADTALAAAVERILGREPDTRPVQLARDMDATLGTLRARARPLDNPLPWRRGRSSYQRTLQVLTGIDHYTRALARLSDHLREPGWAPTLQPAAARVRANLDALRRLLLHRPGEIRSAEALVDAAETHAARTLDSGHRVTQLRLTRLLRRIDQTVVGFATDLGHPDQAPQSPTLSSNA